MAKRFTLEILMKLAQSIGANPKNFMGTRSNITFLGKGPTKNPLFQSPLAGIDEASMKQLGPGMIPAVEDAMGFASAGKLNSIQMEILGNNILGIKNVMQPPVLPSATVTDIAPGIAGLKRFPRETHKFFGRPLKSKDFSEIDRMVMEGKIPDARGRQWNLKTPGTGPEVFNKALNQKTGMSRAIARELLLQDTRLKLKPEELFMLKEGKGEPLDLMRKYYGRSVTNYDEFLNNFPSIKYPAPKQIAARILAEVELTPQFAEGGLADILQAPRRGRVVHPGGYAGSKWTKMFRDLGKAGGSRQDFKDLYFKMKSEAVPIDLTIHDMMMSGALQSELKHGGLAGILEV